VFATFAVRISSVVGTHLRSGSPAWSDFRQDKQPVLGSFWIALLVCSALKQERIWLSTREHQSVPTRSCDTSNEQVPTPFKHHASLASMTLLIARGHTYGTILVDLSTHRAVDPTF
jgi:hypothetical protein